MTTERKRRRRTDEQVTILAKAAGKPVEAPTNRNAENSENLASSWGPGVDGLSVITPPYDQEVLIRLREDSDELNQCIEAVVAGIAGAGVMPVVDLTDEVKATIDPLLLAAERAEIENFLAHCGQADTFADLYLKCQSDLQQFGCWYIEVIRDARGRIIQLEHVCAAQVRHLSLEQESVQRRYKQRLRQADGTWSIKPAIEFRRFRRFVQMAIDGDMARKVYFKELGDPRMISRVDGHLITDEEIARGDRIDPLAHEILHFSRYNPSGSSYGVPPYIGALYAITGSRFAEKANITTFRNNNVPSMAVTVSGGVLNGESIERINQFVNTHIEGSQNLSRFLVLEAESAFEGEEAGSIKVSITPLTNVQRSDGMFKEFQIDCRGVTRRQWRLPGLIVGDSQEWAGAAIEGARRYSDETIFAPERDRWDRIINRHLAPELGWIYHRLSTITPNTTDNMVLATILNNMEKTGGLTPEIARRILEKILGESFGTFPSGFKADVPFSLTMAEAVKNQADPAEPGQQVTAIK